MDTTNTFKFNGKIKSFYNAWTKCCCPKKKTTKLNGLKSMAKIAGVFTIVYSTILVVTVICVYNDYDSKSGNSTLSASLNQTKAENSTTLDNEKQNLRNSTTDGDDYLPKQPLGFPAICGIILYVLVINSSIMLLYGALKEYKHLLLPWMICAPASMIGILTSFYIYPCREKTLGWAIGSQIYGVFMILYITGLFLTMIDYYGLLAERDRVKRAIDGSRPIPTVLPGETEC